VRGARDACRGRGNVGRVIRRFALGAALALCCLAATPVSPAPAVHAVDPSLYAGLRWRMIGPFRGGRALAVGGVAGDGRTFYFGAVGGGVWKTTSAGSAWTPVFDGAPVASIGALTVAPSDPNVIYVGSGEADMRSDIQRGDGVYRSRDGGATWTHVGLDDSRQIGRILVDPHDPNTLLVAVLGHQYGPNDMRGVYRSTDGGATWTRTLFRDRDTGAIDLASDPSMRVVYASLWQTRRPPWSVYPPSNGPGSGLMKSTDGGVTWTPLHGGVPSAGLGKIGLAVAPSDPNRVYAIVDADAGGLYRSDDAGATWKRDDKDARLWQRGWYFCHVAVDPKNADVVYVSDTAFYRSTDGGASFTAIKGSPDGDDFHTLWIDPTDGDRLALVSDQGASISLDRGTTWSTWFNQPTGQFYNVRADDAFPYHLYGTQQDSGAAMIVSRSAHSGIEERDWRPLNAGGESGSIAPDPDDPDRTYGNGPVLREDLRTAQSRLVAPTMALPGVWRAEWTQPMAFGVDRALYTANQVVFRSRDAGAHWQTISRDLTRTPRGVVYSLAPSPIRAGAVWAGTDDGRVQLTRDGGRSWHDVTPPGVAVWSSIDGIDASRFDANTAYVAVDRHRLDDDRPYVYVTHDAGRTWRSASRGIADGAFVYVVREDPRRRGLLYAATETGVFVSFDDGAGWQSLRLNLPPCSVHDLIVKNDDVAIATHGRAFWVLDDVTPLRQLAARASAGARLFAPADAVRFRPYNDEAEASPPEVPMGANPPYGAPIDYVIPVGARRVQLTLADARGAVVRAWSSGDAVATPDPSAVDYPAYWLASPARLSASPGMHRFFWDMHASPQAVRRGRPRAGDGAFVAPGAYRVTLRVDGRAATQTLVIRRDPRVPATDADLRAQYALARAIDLQLARVQAAIDDAGAARTKPGANVARIDAIAGVPPVVDPRNSVGTAPTRFTTLRWYASALTDLFASVESADERPTPHERTTWGRVERSSEIALRAWRRAAPRPATP